MISFLTFKTFNEMKFLMMLISVSFVCCNPSVPPPHQKASEYTSISWNMRGTGVPDDRKWQILGNFLNKADNCIYGHREIVALQDCPEIPHNMIATKRTLTDQATGQLKTVDYVPLSSAVYGTNIRPFLTELPRPESDVNPSPWIRPSSDVREYEWSFYNKLYYVYYVTCHIGQSARVSMAIASVYRADEVIVYRESAIFSRPIIGMKIGNSYFFSVQIERSVTYPSYKYILDIEKSFFAESASPIISTSWVIMGLSYEHMNKFQCLRIGYSLQYLYKNVNKINNMFGIAVVGDKEVESRKFVSLQSRIISSKMDYKCIIVLPE